MDARVITPRYAVSPQISVEDIPAIAAAGYRTVICNRPDAEVPQDFQAATIGAAVEAAGLTFKELPLTHQTMTPENVAAQRSFYEDCDGPVLAYCASGTRSSVIWSLGVAKELSADEILSKTSAAGYQLDGLRPTLEAIAKS
ncbi:Beta-lactamase hydrolase-like protein [Phaeobacter sp. CECT 5382]|uniref:TIGR01244 family sulfur transferase n=1 Tax=Rhodobacterales TaxID=204455 RepID=UPI0006DA6FF7|nr:TIGR01244 family sulfur transferase [Phaeobacter sp. CECT 5382]CUH86171.1 Beta-lactamase hydrolase-like protein [Phaeobacter sp. CECT 5382]